MECFAGKSGADLSFVQVESTAEAFVKEKEMTFELAEKYGADFVQIDSVCGHLTLQRDSVYANELIELMKGRNFQVLGGWRLK